MGWDLWVKGANSLAEWDLAYQVRAEENEKVAICKVLFLELKDPFSLNENFIQKIFGWFPGTQTPRILRANELRRFKVWLSFKGIQIH